jgi:hypothetical protein
MILNNPQLRIDPTPYRGVFILWVFMNMKYIITESRLQDIFDRYMESTYDLRYYSEAREFRAKVRWGIYLGTFGNRGFFMHISQMRSS